MKQSKRTVHLWKINIILLPLLFVGFSYVNNVENTHVSTTIGDYLSGVNNIINGGFENNSISSNYEYISIDGWNSVTHNNKILVSKNGQIPTEYFVEINSNLPNSYYKDIKLEKIKIILLIYHIDHI